MPNFKSKIEKNPFIVLISCVGAFLVISSGVQQYFYKQQTDVANARCQAVVEDANSKLASIKRGISGGEYLDLRKLLYTFGEPVNVPEKSKFISSDQFYADLDSTDWDYSVTTEAGLMNLLGDVKKADVPEKLWSVSNTSPVHLWKAKTTYDIKGGDLVRAFPYISVEKIPLSRFKTISQIGISLGIEESLKTSMPSTSPSIETAEQVASKLDKIFRGDAASSLLYYQMEAYEHASIDSPDIGFYIVQMQKVGNVLYCQTLVTIKDVKVGDQSYAVYYVRQEFMIVSTTESVYVVTIFVPSPDPAPRGKVFSAVNAWLAGFRIRVS